MNKVFNKIKEIRKSLGLTQTEFANAAGVNASDVSKLESGDKKFIDINIIRFLKIKGVDVNSLFDDSLSYKPSESHLIEEELNKNIIGYPLLPIEAFAGISSDTDYSVNFNSIKDRYVIPLFDGKEVDFLIHVRGNSMYPKYSSGDVVACKFIKELLYVQWNKVYVIDTKSQGAMIKRLKKSEKTNSITFKSDNKDYEEFDVPKTDIRNIALVIGVIRLE